jgi:hypothetical protein
MEHEVRKFLGMWIPSAIWNRKSISIQEKTFLAEINSLNLNGKGCFRSNGSFGDFFNITPNSCGRIIDRLVKKGLVIREIDDSKTNKNRRRLWVVEGLLEPVRASPLRVTPPKLASPQRVRRPHPNGGGGLTPTGEALYIEENTVENTKRNPAGPVCFSIEELLEKIPKGKSGYRLGLAIQSQSYLEYEFMHWFIIEAIGRFTKKIELTETQLSDWQGIFKRYTEPIMTTAIRAILLSDETKGCLPSLGLVIKHAKILHNAQIIAKPEEPKPKTKPGGKIIPLRDMTVRQLRKALKKQADNVAESSRIRGELSKRVTAKAVEKSRKKHEGDDAKKKV